MHSLLRAAGAAALVLTSHAALAQDEPPAAPPTEAPPPEKVEMPPSEPPTSSSPSLDEPDKDQHPNDATYRDHGFRLGLDLAFNRSLGGAEGRVNQSTPSLIPIGADISLRASPGFLVGIHGYAALASRDDCVDGDSCRARGYGFGAHIEGTPIRAPKYAGYIRFGAGYEVVYHGGLPLNAGGHESRGAFDMADLRIGADFIVHRGENKKTMRLGPYIGGVISLLTSDSGVIALSGNQQQIRNDNPLAASGWFQIGMRGTLDP